MYFQYGKQPGDCAAHKMPLWSQRHQFSIYSKVSLRKSSDESFVCRRASALTHRNASKKHIFALSALNSLKLTRSLTELAYMETCLEGKLLFQAL